MPPVRVRHDRHQRPVAEQGRREFLRRQHVGELGGQQDQLGLGLARAAEHVRHLGGVRHADLDPREPVARGRRFVADVVDACHVSPGG